MFDARSAVGVLIGLAVPALVNDLKDDVRRSAAIQLATIASMAQAAVPVLIDALKDNESIVRGGAAEALGNFGAGAKAGVSALIEALNDGVIGWANWRGSQQKVGSIARSALSQIDPEAARKAAV
jgi:HEAT repeat protein